MRNLISCSLSVCVAAAALSGCGEKDKDTPAVTTALEGTWAYLGSTTDGCNTVDDNSDGTPDASFTITATFVGYSVTVLEKYFSDATCTTKFAEKTETQTFTLAAADANAALPVDYKHVKTMLTLYGSTVTGSSGGYEYTDWASGVAKDITGRKESPSDTESETAAGAIEYALVKIDGTKLYMGDDSNGKDGKTAANRPTVVSSSFYLTKK